MPLHLEPFPTVSKEDSKLLDTLLIHTSSTLMNRSNVRPCNLNRFR